MSSQPNGKNNRGTIYSWASFVCGLSLIVAFNNCSEVEFQRASNTSAVDALDSGLGDPDAGSTTTTLPGETTTTLPASTSTTTSSTTTTTQPDEGDVDEVNVTCENGTRVTSTFSPVFPDPNVTCPFGVGDNLNRRNQYFQARIEQNFGFDLPEGSIICGANFQFASQQMKYDDHMILAFNNIVLASTYDFSNNWEMVLDLPRYDWSRLAGTRWNTSMEGVFCLGASDGLSSCSWPDTDTTGSISLSFDSSLFQRIMAVDTSNYSHNFKMITIGDDDNGDCEHSNITFDVTVEYVEDAGASNP